MTQLTMNKTGASLIEEHKFKAVRIINNSLIAVTFTLRYSYVAQTDDIERDEEDIIIANHRLKYWVSSSLNDVVVVGADDKDNVEMVSSNDNLIILTPGDPRNALLVELLFCKLNAIAGDTGIITSVSLHSDDDNQTAQFVEHENFVTLNEDYLENSYFDKPWWERPSFECVDFTKEEYETDVELQEYVMSVDPLEVLNEDLRDQFAAERRLSGTQKEAEIIKLPKKWNPKIV